MPNSKPPQSQKPCLPNSKSDKLHKPNPTVDKRALIFGLTSVLLCGVGFGVITPVVPFLVEPYVNNSGDQAIAVTMLISVYAFCVFFAAPGLGALSDRFGRRPLLLVSLLASAIGFIVFGIGGALWVLFAGRIIEGIAGGSISTLFAYFADITPKAQRTKYFGWMSAMMGVGFFVGPTLGGLLANFGYQIPLFAGAAITLLNLIFGCFFMQESLDKGNRLEKITIVRLNPFSQLASILSIKNLGRLLIAGFLLWIPAGSFQAVFSQYTIDTFNWMPVLIGLMFSIIGIQDIVSQGLIMPQLLKRLSDSRISTLGMAAEIAGYACIAASALLISPVLFVVGMFIYGFGDSIFGPSFNGMISKSVDAGEQGRVQGGSQSIQALARIIGPVVGGQIYVLLGHFAPFIMGMVLVAAAMLVLKGKKSTIAP
ncbi:tetracycline resistance MFS efflux pump [Actinomycetota bacterium]|nr:tetracycline resistance MFS efflux pump [Actinomycetota bacterium]